MKLISHVSSLSLGYQLLRSPDFGLLTNKKSMFILKWINFLNHAIRLFLKRIFIPELQRCLS